jgi:septal ring factor EnvC (AmiA/AmiB activator)
MQSSAPAETPTDGQGDIIFSCERCTTPLVVDSAAAGLTLTCQRCGGPTTVPHPSESHVSENLEPGSIQERLAELRRHLRENESQRTEINGYINQLSIQLHRWQNRLQTLDERNKQLTDDVARCVVAASS